MAKKTREALYKEARELYLSTDLKFTEIAERLNIKINTLYTISTRESWALLKESNIKEIISDKNMLLNDRKLKSIKFYSDIMDKCISLLTEPMGAKELKEVVATHIIAEDRLFLLSKSQLEEAKQDNDSGGGILDELAGI